MKENPFVSGAKWKTLAYQFSPWSAWASAIPISALGQAFLLQLPSWPLPSPLTVSHGLWVKSFPGHTSALPSSDLASALEVSPANPCQSHSVLQLPQVCYWSPRLTRLCLCTCFPLGLGPFVSIW